MLFFSERMRVEDYYRKQSSSIGMPFSINGLLAFMNIKGWLNEDKIRKDICLPVRKENK